MPKQFIIDIEDSYPFGCRPVGIDSDYKVLIQENYQADTQQELDNIKTLALVKKAITHQNLVEIEYSAIEGKILRIFHQYVPFSVLKWAQTAEPSHIDTIKEQIFDLIDFLKIASVKFKFHIANLGIGDSKQAKYFLQVFQIGVMDLDAYYQTEKKKIGRQLDLLKKIRRIDSPGKKELSETISTNKSTNCLNDKVKTQASEQSPLCSIPILNRKISTLDGLNHLVMEAKRKSHEALSALKAIHSCH